MPQTLTVGRIVHYTHDNGDIRPAIVTHVHNDDNADITVFNSVRDKRSPFQTLGSVPRSDGPAEGMWNWPALPPMLVFNKKTGETVAIPDTKPPEGIADQAAVDKQLQEQIKAGEPESPTEPEPPAEPAPV